MLSFIKHILTVVWTKELIEKAVYTLNPQFISTCPAHFFGSPATTPVVERSTWLKNKINHQKRLFCIDTTIVLNIRESNLDHMSKWLRNNIIYRLLHHLAILGTAFQLLKQYTYTKCSCHILSSLWFPPFGANNKTQNFCWWHRKQFPVSLNIYLNSDEGT